MKNNEWKLHLITLIVGGVIYSFTSFAYMHANFSSKDLMELILNRIDRIELKIDKFIENYNNHK